WLAQVAPGRKVAFWSLLDKDRVILRWRLRRVVSAPSRSSPSDDTRRRQAAGARSPRPHWRASAPCVGGALREGERAQQLDSMSGGGRPFGADPQEGGRASDSSPWRHGTLGRVDPHPVLLDAAPLGHPVKSVATPLTGDPSERCVTHPNRM